jgi:hypothetical protein
MISSAWQLNGPTATLNVTIPPNTTAKIHLPILGTAVTNLVIRESGVIVWQNGQTNGSVTGVTFDRVDDSNRFLIWDVEAGTYQFVWNVAVQVPGALTATVDNQIVNLTWNPVVAATGYNVKRSPASGGPFLLLTNVSAVNYADHSVTNGFTYFYAVSAVTTNGESADSEPVSATPRLDLNLGFEKTRVGDYQYNPAGAVWTFSGSTDNGSGLLANGSAFSNPNAPEGTQAAFVQQYGTVSQAFSGFSPGTTYTLRFSAAQRPGPNQHGGESWNVKIDGNVITNYNPGAGATAYVDYTASFVATATNHTLSFVGTDLAGGDNTVFIDNVRFTPPIPPVAPGVALTSPSNSVTLLAPASVSLAAAVISNGNFIGSVQFFSNASNLLAQDFTPPYSFAWTNINAGSYQARARVFFNGTNFVDSESINIVVTNTPPVIQSVGLVAGNFFLTATGQAGVSAVLMTATSLAPPVSWWPLLTNPPAAGGWIAFSNLPVTNSQQFYRVATP